MKFSASAIAIILGVTHATATTTCVNGQREVIAPGYTVEYKCDVAKLGGPKVNAESANACAELARDAGVSASTYNPATKKCVVAADDGKEVASKGSILMFRVPEPEPEVIEDPFLPEEKDPFAPDLEEEVAACLEREKESEAAKKECLDREAALKVDSDKIKADSESVKAEKAKVDARLKDLMAANCPTQHGKYSVINNREYRVWCSRHHDANGFKEELKDIHTLADCADECTRRSWCVYAHQGIHQTLCRLYDRKISAATQPGLSTPQWHCAVKK
ncbi:hypothetical protein FLONG3_733 [Fusarium longipes]|uniref:Apple domain-containing protein n=1 Tax=Fusarium longipes TaxID=694270 RepID=A0A395T9Q1_9HYPO|nr:hypothetical protein FLONG3_733 [Fusarium longipes]